MALDLVRLDAAVEAFVTERHLATLTLVRPDGTPHVTPVGFTFDHPARQVRIITFASSVKARLLHDSRPAAVSQVDGRRWLTFEGTASVHDDPLSVAQAVEAYSRRYRPVSPRADRVVIEVAVTALRGRV